jgi:hypothetical protein
MTIKIDQVSNAHWVGNDSIRFFVKVCRRGRCVQSLFHTNLMDEQKGHSVAPHEDSTQTYQSINSFSNLSDNRSNASSKEYKVENKITTKAHYLQIWRLKQHWSLFFNVIHKEFMPEGKIVNKEFHGQVLARLWNQISRVGLQFWEKSSWFLLHDNMPTHSDIIQHTA